MEEFNAQHAKEQHMTAVGHWTRRYQTSWVDTVPRTIRSALVDVAVMHAHDIVAKEGFKELVYEGGDFAVEGYHSYFIV